MLLGVRSFRDHPGHVTGLIPEGFPGQLGNEELHDTIRSLVDVVETFGPAPPLLTVALAEQSRRELHTASVIAKLALAVALLALAITVFVSFR